MKLYANILGDLAGQPYEFNYKGDFSEFNLHDPRSIITDDTIMTLATAYAILEYDYPQREDFERVYKDFAKKYNGDYYGSKFKEWINSDFGTIGNSWGNGALMRISPCFYMDKEAQLGIALNSAFTSHFSIEVYDAIRAYEMYAGHMFSVFQERQAKGRYDILKAHKFEKFDASVMATRNLIGTLVRKCISTHDAIETAVKLGGDTDTNACVIGELFSKQMHDLTLEDRYYVESKLDDFLLNILWEFNNYEFG